MGSGFSSCLLLTPLRDAPLAAADEPSARDVTFYVGIAIAIVSSLFQALGMVLQRLAHIQEHDRPEALRRNVFSKPLWLLGLVLYIGSQTGGQILALNFLSPVVLAPLGSVTLVFNALFARLLLSETFDRIDAAGTVFVVLGAVLIAVFGYVPEPTFLLDELVTFFGATPMIVFMTGVGTLAVLGTAAGWQLEAHVAKPESSALQRLLGAVSRARLESVLGMLYGALAGVLGSGTILLAKISVQLLSTSLAGDNQFAYVGTYVIVFTLIALGVLQVVFLNKGLAIAPSTLVVPIFFCVWTLFAMVQTIVYFDQWPCYSGAQIGAISAAIVIIAMGVVCLSRVKPAVRLHDEDEDDGSGVGDMSETIQGDASGSTQVVSSADFARYTPASASGPATLAGDDEPAGGDESLPLLRQPAPTGVRTRSSDDTRSLTDITPRRSHRRTLSSLSSSAHRTVPDAAYI